MDYSLLVGVDAEKGYRTCMRHNRLREALYLGQDIGDLGEVVFGS